MDTTIVFLDTVKENKMFYTEHQIERAEIAQELYHVLGIPLFSDFVAILRMNLIKNNPVLLSDVALVGKDFWSQHWFHQMHNNTTTTITCDRGSHQHPH